MLYRIHTEYGRLGYGDLVFDSRPGLYEIPEVHADRIRSKFGRQIVVDPVPDPDMIVDKTEEACLSALASEALDKRPDKKRRKP